MSESVKRSSFGALPVICVLTAPLVLAVLLAAPATAESNAATAEAPVEAGADGSSGGASGDDSASARMEVELQEAAPSRGSDVMSKLQVHGFLTQAWAEADFLEVEVGMRPPPPFGPGGVGPLGGSPNGSEISRGIPEDGTTDYRFLALQFRYQISPKDTFVVQFSSRALGFSTIQEFEDDIELDWAFYERRITDDTRLKVGRVQIPFGIYNEIRDVGTVLPFYRPSFVHYKESSFTSETVDGLSFGHKFFSQSDWNLDITLFGGEWESIEFVPGQPQVSGPVPQENGYGFQLWLRTPLPELRIGAGLLSFRQGNSPFPFEAQERRDVFHASLDATFNRFTIQAEWDEEETDLLFNTIPITTTTTNWYVLAGLRITEKFRVWAQFERAEFEQQSITFLNDSFNYDGISDAGVALNYYFTPALVLKGEYHWIEGENFTLFPDLSTGALLLRPQVFSYDNGSYSIVALSVSF